MADEKLGSVFVDITGDFSELQKALQDAARAASTGAEEISRSIATTGAAALESTERFHQFAESLAGIGEALAITEALKEFGTEALEVAGTVQRTSIALGQLTGSAEEAESIIGSIKDIAATQPFAFPELAPTVQRMVALGVTAEQLPAAMQAVADSAAATGNSFSAVASAFDRVALSGNAGTRQLVALGLSTADLGRAMGVTTEQVKVAFSALDESQRIEVLDAALAKFAGASEAQAKGIAGEWQIFQNQFEEVMEAVGDALTPAVSEILEAGKSILSTIKGMIDAFNALPAPARAVSAELAIAAASIGTLALGASNLVGLLGNLRGLFQQTGAAAKEAAVGEAALAGATEELAIAQKAVGADLALTAEAAAGTAGASTAAAAGVAGLGISLTGLAAVAAGPVVASLIAMKSNLGDLEAKWDELLHEIVSRSIVDAVGAGKTVEDLQKIGYTVEQIKGAFTNFGVSAADVFSQLSLSTEKPLKAIADLGIPIKDVQAALNSLKVDGLPVFALMASSPDIATFKERLEALGGDLDMVARKLNALHPAADFKPLADGLDIVVHSSKLAEAGLSTLETQQKKANAAMSAAKDVLDLARKGLDGTTASQEVYNRALAAWQQEADKANPKAKDFADSIAGIKEKLDAAQTAFVSSVAILGQIERQAPGTTAGLAAIAEAYEKAQQKAKGAGQAFADAAGEQAKLSLTSAQAKASFDALAIVYTNLEKSLTSGTLSTNDQVTASLQLIDVNTKLLGLASQLGITWDGTTAEMVKLNVTAVAQQTALEGVTRTYTSLASLGDRTKTQQDAIAAAFKNVATDAAALGLSVQKVGDGLLFTATDASKATPELNALAVQMTLAASKGIDFVTVNEKLTPTLQSVSDASTKQTSVSGVLANAWTKIVTTADGAQVAVTKFSDSAGKSVVNLQAAADAAQRLAIIQADLGTTYYSTQTAINGFILAGAKQVNTVEDAVKAFVDLDSTTQKTVAGQIALQNAFKNAQQAGAALGITITANGASTNSTSTAVQQLARDLNDAIQKMNTGASAGNNFETALKGIASGAAGASKYLDTLKSEIEDISKDVQSFDSILGRPTSGSISSGAAPGSSIHFGGSGQDVTVPLPKDPNPGRDYWDGSEWASIPDTYDPNNPYKNVIGTFVPPTGSGTSTPSAGGSTSAYALLDTAATSAAGSIASLGSASSDAVTPLGAFADSATLWAEATKSSTSAANASVPVVQALSKSASDFYTVQEKASGVVSQATQSYDSALASSINAQNAYTQALADLRNGASISADQLYALQKAVSDTSDALSLLTGEGAFGDAAQKVTTALLNTSYSANDFYTAQEKAAGSIGATTQAYDTALATSTNAQNAYSNALAQVRAGADISADALYALQKAASDAQQSLTFLSGVSKGETDGPTRASADALHLAPDVAMPPNPPAGTNDPNHTGGYRWSPNDDKWVWDPNQQGIAGHGAISGGYDPFSNPPTAPYTPHPLDVPIGSVSANNGGVPQVTIQVNVGGTYVGPNAGQQLADLAAPAIVASLRRAGIKL